MKYSSPLRWLCLALVFSPAASMAQSFAATGMECAIPGFSVVSSTGDAISVPVDPSGTIESTASVIYETNMPDQTVYVQVDGDLTGLEIRIEPQGDTILGMAATGVPGTATAAVFHEAGILPLVTGVTAAGVDLGLKYTVVALDPEAAARAADVRISYAIN